MFSGRNASLCTALTHPAASSSAFQSRARALTLEFVSCLHCHVSWSFACDTQATAILSSRKGFSEGNSVYKLGARKLAVFWKTIHAVTLRPSVCTLGQKPVHERSQQLYLQQPKAGNSPTSFRGRMAKQTPVHLHHGVLLNNEKGQILGWVSRNRKLTGNKQTNNASPRRLQAV